MQIDSYISYIAGVRRYSLRTQEIYRSVLEEFRDYSGDLSTTGIRNYEVHLLDDRKTSARTADLHLSVISGYCRWAMKQGQLASNPVKLVPKPKTEKRLPVFYREESIKDYLKSTEPAASQDQLDLLLSLPASDGTAAELYGRRLRRLIVSMLYGTALRRSELISLNIASADFSRRVLSVRGKGDKMREIPLTPSLCEEISLYLSAVSSLTDDAQDPAAPLLRTPKGARLYPVFVDRVVKKELAAVPGITVRRSPHVLRHTLATELLQDGADLNSIKELLGHSSLAATQVYTHNTVERLQKVYTNAHPRAKNGGKNGD